MGTPFLGCVRSLNCRWRITAADLELMVIFGGGRVCFVRLVALASEVKYEPKRTAYTEMRLAEQDNRVQ